MKLQCKSGSNIARVSFGRSLRSSIGEQHFNVAGVRLALFQDPEKLNHAVSELMIGIFQQNAFVALAADSTHGNDPNANGAEGRFGNIYAKTDIYFSCYPEVLHPKLRLTNLDEIDPTSVRNPKKLLTRKSPTESFAENIKAELGFVISSIQDRWQPLDPAAPHKYIENFYKKPQLRYAFIGLGAGPEGAHVAYFGERQNIFSTTSRIKLSAEEAKRRNADFAYSCGEDALRALDGGIVISAKEARKSASLAAGFEDAISGSQIKTGLGWLIRYKPHLLRIMVDREAAHDLFTDKAFKLLIRKRHHSATE